MGKIFLNKKFNAPNVIEVSINLEKLKEFEIIKKSYIWNTNKEIFKSEQFSSIKPNWGGDMEWISANNINTYNFAIMHNKLNSFFLFSTSFYAFKFRKYFYVFFDL